MGHDVKRKGFLNLCKRWEEQKDLVLSYFGFIDIHLLLVRYENIHQVVVVL